MFNTFERELFANQRHQELLRSFAERQRTEQATRTERTTGLLATLFGRRRSAPAARPATAARAA